MHRLDLIGQKFNRLTVVSKILINKHTFQVVVCDCGNKTKTNSTSLVRGKIKSCGCLSRERTTTHNLSRTPTYKSWQMMRQRCTNIHDDSYPHYGARGITVCEKWGTFEGFYEDMGDRSDGTTLDRIDVNGHYCKENCRWATNETQQNNKRNNTYVQFNNKIQTLAQWARELNIDYELLLRRIVKNGRDIGKVLTEAMAAKHLV